MITYTKLRDGSWGVRGPLDDIAPGATVTVTKRSGETAEVQVEAVVWENTEIAIARIAAQAQPAREQAAPREAVEVAAGRYALDLGGRNVTEFFKVDTPTDGRWAGWTFVKQQAGENEYPVKGARKAEVLAAIKADPTEALLRYGLLKGRCGRCGIELTDDVSRADGIGPDCASHLGIPRSSREEAATILAAREAAERGVTPLSTQHGEYADALRVETAQVVTQHNVLPGESWDDIFKS